MTKDIYHDTSTVNKRRISMTGHHYHGNGVQGGRQNEEDRRPVSCPEIGLSVSRHVLGG